MSTFNEQLAQLEEYQSGIKNLEASGITEAYEYVLRKLCQDGLPTNNYFDLCAVYLLEFETIMKERDISSTPLKKLIEEQQAKISEQNKIKKNISTENSLNKKVKSKELGASVVNRAVEKNVKNISNRLNNAIPQNKLKLKSVEYSVTNFRVEIENQKNSHEKINVFELNKKLELNSKKFDSKKSLTNPLKVDIDSIKSNFQTNNQDLENDQKQIPSINDIPPEQIVSNEELMKKYIEEKDEELKNIKSTTPLEVSYTQIPLESFELQVDLLNNLSKSGEIENFKYELRSKPNAKNFEFEQLNQQKENSIKEQEAKLNQSLKDSIKSVSKSNIELLKEEGIEDIFH